ncbi:hypothetical protein KCU64_g72, partial [Aureobasidium melanogenum]
LGNVKDVSIDDQSLKAGGVIDQGEKQVSMRLAAGHFTHEPHELHGRLVERYKGVDTRNAQITKNATDSSSSSEKISFFRGQQDIQKSVRWHCLAGLDAVSGNSKQCDGTTRTQGLRVFDGVDAREQPARRGETASDNVANCYCRLVKCQDFDMHEEVPDGGAASTLLNISNDGRVHCSEHCPTTDVYPPKL